MGSTGGPPSVSVLFSFRPPTSPGRVGRTVGCATRRTESVSVRRGGRTTPETLKYTKPDTVVCGALVPLVSYVGPHLQLFVLSLLWTTERNEW